MDFSVRLKRKTAGESRLRLYLKRSDGFSRPCNELNRYYDNPPGGARNTSCVEDMPNFIGIHASFPKSV
jgi:hypothetical protein